MKSILDFCKFRITEAYKKPSCKAREMPSDCPLLDVNKVV